MGKERRGGVGREVRGGGEEDYSQKLQQRHELPTYNLILAQ